MRYQAEEFAERYGLPPFGEFVKLARLCAGTGPWICGGAVRRWVLGEKKLHSDVDLFCPDDAGIEALRVALKDDGFSCSAENEFNFQYRKDGHCPVQVIRITGATVTDVLDRFDFTICQFGFDGSDLIVGPYSLWDLARKRMAVHRITYPAASIRRSLKYAQQGYTLCSGAATSLLTQVVNNPQMLDLSIEYVD